MLIFGIFGSLRSQEFINIETSDVEDTLSTTNTSQYIVTINDTKNDYPRKFIIGDYDIVRKYILLRPTNMPSNRFFIQYHNGACQRQVIGKNKISESPKNIACYLNLNNPEGYTGHCFRRSSATAAARADLPFSKIKHLGGWKSDAVVHGYIEHSLVNKENIFNTISNQNKNNCATLKNTIQQSSTAIPSTSKTNSNQTTLHTAKIQQKTYQNCNAISMKNSRQICTDNENTITENLIEPVIGEKPTPFNAEIVSSILDNTTNVKEPSTKRIKTTNHNN